MVLKMETIKPKTFKKGRIKMKKTILFVVAVAVLMAVVGPVFASTNAGMPWERPMEIIMRSLTGPVAFFISVIALVVCVITLLWGAEISDIIKKLIYAVILISVLVGASSLLSRLFGISAALI